MQFNRTQNCVTLNGKTTKPLLWNTNSHCQYQRFRDPNQINMTRYWKNNAATVWVSGDRTKATFCKSFFYERNPILQSFSKLNHLSNDIRIGI